MNINYSIFGRFAEQAKTLCEGDGLSVFAESDLEDGEHITQRIRKSRVRSIVESQLRYDFFLESFKIEDHASVEEAIIWVLDFDSDARFVDYRAVEAQKLDNEIARYNPKGVPGSPEWFRSLESAINAEIERESAYACGEQLAERYAEMRMGAQSEEGFWDDQDYARGREARCSNLLERIAAMFPVAWMRYKGIK